MRKINLVPMAGEGKRFLDEGYKVPKPLIMINSIPMFVRAAKALPKADLFIFICLKNHVIKFKINKVIKKFGYYPNMTTDQYLFRYLYVDLFTKNVLQKIKKNFDNEVLVIISSDHWNRNKNTDKDYVGRSFMLIKNLDDEANFTVNKKNSTIIIPKLIKNYFFTNSNSNKDIFEYSNTLDEPIHIKRNRF